MPGLTLWLSPGVGPAGSALRFEDAQASMCHAPDYRARLEFEAGGCRMGHVAYPEYPVRYIRRPSFVVALEGRVFGRTGEALEAELAQLAKAALGDPEESTAALRRWTLANDGDYVIALAAGDGRRLVVLTDPLGRLPLYVHVGELGVIVARECKFIARIRGTAEFDRIGWAQCLWMGYPLGQRTTFAEVSRAPGGFHLRAEAVDGGVESTVEALFTCNFDEKDESVPRSLWPQRLADSFLAATAACVKTDEPSPVVLSLSGGHDSRCVAAALRRSGVGFSAATYRAEGRPGHGSWADSRIAERIAKQFEIPWELVPVAEPDAAEVRRVVWMTDGLNAMALILGFLDHLVSRFGRNAIFVTGGGGDKAMPDRRPLHPAGDPDQLLRAVIGEHAVLGSHTAEAVMGLEPGALERDLADHLACYPEGDPAQKGAHFRIYERGRNMLFPAEDRNRLYLWHASPFWTFSFFRLAMSAPDELKTRYALYDAFQERLDPSLTRIEHTAMGIPVRVPGFGRDRDLLTLGRHLPRPVRAAVRRMLGGKGQTPATAQRPAAAGMGREEPAPDSIMDVEAVRAMLENASPKQYTDWRTLALLEELWAQKP